MARCSSPPAGTRAPPKRCGRSFSARSGWHSASPCQERRKARGGDRNPRYGLVRRAIDCLREQRNRGQWPNVEELCREVGSNRRALERAFAEVLHISPYQFLLKLRLGLCRSALLRARGAASVQRIALDHGFCNASEFSLHYRRFVGELPSATLRGDLG